MDAAMQALFAQFMAQQGAAVGYPKWVQRAPHIGHVLCANAAEEKELMDTWNAEVEATAKAAAEAAEKAAAEAKAQAELTLKGSKK
jgi:hypothetical protein